ncbi:hypothetical protein [Candidatus Palauibacter sp.]|uniref:hypothetical protein n=1 Tax=Candidatus Palauibacter sp. TaxID=3101350 RepID=UPI003B5B3C45
MSIYETLGRIDAELALGHGAEPQRALTDLIRNMSRPVLEEWRVDLQARIDRFQPKRHLELQQLFDERTGVQPANDAGLTDAMVRERPAVAEDLYFQIDATDSNFKGALRTLGEKHIFQWATSYTQSLSHHFNCYLPLLQSELAGEAAHSIQRQLEEHTRAIFTQGYKYGQQRGLTQDILTQKSIGGLASLLDLPLDYYLQRASYSHTREETSSLRSLLSASIRGILRGYASLRLGDIDGATLLARFPNRWAYQLAFLSTDAIEDIVTQLPEGSLKVGLGTAALPLFDCLDSLMSRPRETYFPLPLFGQFSWEHRRLDVGVRSPSAWGSDRVIYARAHLAEAFVSERDLDDAAARRFAVVMAPLNRTSAARNAASCCDVVT